MIPRAIWRNFFLKTASCSRPTSSRHFVVFSNTSEIYSCLLTLNFTRNNVFTHKYTVLNMLWGVQLMGTFSFISSSLMTYVPQPLFSTKLCSDILPRTSSVPRKEHFWAVFTILKIFCSARDKMSSISLTFNARDVIFQCSLVRLYSSPNALWYWVTFSTQNYLN